MRALTVIRRRAAGALCLSALLVLGACGQIELGSTRSERMETTQYTMVSTGRAWIYVPDGLLTLERDLGGVREQRIALPNQTLMDGDNVMLLRTRQSRGLTGGRLKLETFLNQSGGLPAPFQNAKHGQLQIAEDALGPYFFLTRTMGPGTTCVLAIRSIKSTAQALPRGADAVDVLLRNCVQGDQAEALEPVRAAAVGRTVGIDRRGEPTQLLNVSPFAAPQAAVR